MKKLLSLLLCVAWSMSAHGQEVLVDVYASNGELCQVKLEPGQSVEIERLLGYEAAVTVHNDGILSRVGTSFLRTVADNPFFSAFAGWALFFKRDRIRDNPLLSVVIGGYLISDFALQMLHSAGQKVTLPE